MTATTSRAAVILEARRDDLNARFARSGANIAPEHMLGYLRRTVAPILDAWEGEPAPPVLYGLFDLGLTGLRAGLVGETDASAFERALRMHMPSLRAHVVATQGAVLRALGNGYLHLVRERGPEVAIAWFDALATSAARCADRTALLALGVVLGWRAGLAEAREVALEQARRLDPALCHALFGVTTLDGDPERRFCAPASRAPLGAWQVIESAGGFVGFGGPFRRPPVPWVVAGRVVCTDGVTTRELFADVFGTRLGPAMWAHAAARDTGGASVERDGTVRVPGGTIRAPELRGAVAAAACGGMVAVALDDSHRVLVLGRREATP